MNIVLNIILLLIGFVLLIKCSDIFVEALSSIATNFKMSKMMIALTVAAFGTCTPELSISFNSIASGNGNMALANVVGSNVINILLIVGLAACVMPIKIKNEVIKKELPILLVITSMFCLSIITNYITRSSDLFILNRWDGLLFIFFFALFMAYIISVIKSKQGFLERSKSKYTMTKSIILVIICCVGIIIGSDLIVDNTTALAEALNISTKIITMTIVVIGTSLPEMTMTVIAAKKKEFDIALGNIIGTNIFNIGIVLGLPLLIFGGFTSTQFNLIDILAVQVAAFCLYYFARNDKTISRVEGIIMISLFLIYYVYVFLS